MARFLTGLRHFRSHPIDLQRIFLAYLVSNLGNFSARLTLAVIIYELTGSNASLAASFIVVKLPMVIFGNALGRIASFLNQRHVLMAADSVSIVLFTFLAFSYKWIGPFWTAACFFASYVIASLFDSAKAHYIARISSTKEELNYTAATIAEIIYMAVALGPFIGGYLIEWLNVSAVLLFNSATFAVSILYVRRLSNMPARMKLGRAMQSAFRVRDGWGIVNNFHIVRSHVLLSRFTVFFACRSITYGLINAIMPVIVLAKLGLGSAGLGNAYLCLCLGAVAGTRFYKKYIGLRIPCDGARQILYLSVASLAEASMLAWCMSSPNALIFYMTCFCYGMPMLMVESRIDYVFLEYAPVAEKGAINGFQQFIKSVGFSVGILLAIPLTRYLEAPLISVIAFVGIMLPLLFLWKSQHRDYCYELGR